MSLQSLRFKAISHLTDSQAMELAKAFLQHNPDQRPQSPDRKQKVTVNRISYDEQSSRNNNSNIGEKAIINKTNQSIILNQNLRESMIDQFSKIPETDKLRQEYSRLWYEKLALESSMQRLIDENTKKDEMIRVLKKQLAENMRHTSFLHH